MHLIPPVQYISTFLSLRDSEFWEQNVESKWENVTVFGLMAGVGNVPVVLSSVGTLEEVVVVVVVVG